MALAQLVLLLELQRCVAVLALGLVVSLCAVLGVSAGLGAGPVLGVCVGTAGGAVLPCTLSGREDG